MKLQYSQVSQTDCGQIVWVSWANEGVKNTTLRFYWEDSDTVQPKKLSQIKLVEHRVAVFSKTFYLLRQQKLPSRSPLISQEVKRDCADCFIFSWKN